MTLVRAGDGESAGSVGTQRQVTVKAFGLRLPVRLHEEVVESDPPRRVTYRVVGGLPLRRHRGEIRLTPLELEEGPGTRMTWTVEATFSIPGLGLPSEWLLRRQLGASLDALVALRVGERPGEMARLVAAAERTAAEQGRLAAEFQARGDPKQWFALVYALVSEAAIDRCRDGDFDHPSWVLRMMPRFHTYYVANLEAWRGASEVPVENHWRTAFAATEAPPVVRDQVVGGITHGLVESVRAHIDGDFPRVLSEIYLTHFASAFDYQEFAPDLARMNEAMSAVSRRLMERMPTLRRLFMRSLPSRLGVALAAWMTYDVIGRRMRAFARGEQIAALTTLLGPYRAQTLTSALVPALSTSVPDSPALSTPGDPALEAPLVVDGDVARVYELLHALLEAAELHRGDHIRDNTVTVVVEGAGAAPLAAEIALALRRLVEVEYPHVGPGSTRVILADAHRSLAALPPALRRVAHVLLAKSGAEFSAASAESVDGRSPPGVGHRVDLLVHAPSGRSLWRLLASVATAKRRAASQLALINRTVGQRGVRWEEFSPGEEIVRQGEPGDSLYVLEKGEAEVVADRDGQESLVVELGPGDHFGERAAFSGQPRSATVRARTPVRALVVERVHALTLSRAVPAFGDSVRRLPAIEREHWRNVSETLCVGFANELGS